MLTMLFWFAYFLFSLVWAVATGVVLLLISCILSKYPYDYYHEVYKKLPNKLIWLIPLLNECRTSPMVLHWLLLNIPIVGTLTAMAVVISKFITPLVLDPVYQRIATWVDSLIDPYLE